MTARARARQAAAEEAERQREAAEQARLVGPAPCDECYVLAPNPSTWTPWYWVHRSDDQPSEEWVCRHECHGPGGETQYVIWYA